MRPTGCWVRWLACASPASASPSAGWQERHGSGVPRARGVECSPRLPTLEQPMTLDVTVQPQPCGALVRGIDLTQALTRAQSSEVRAAWLAHQVLAFPDQPLSVDDLERFAQTIGPFGPDPYFESIPGHPHVAQVKRDANETTTIFADTWHSDWSFLASPPAGTLLYGDVIPPVGGDTLFANQYDAWAALPQALQAAVQHRLGVHSARRGYSRQGRYGEGDKGRSMA